MNLKNGSYEEMQNLIDYLNTSTSLRLLGKDRHQAFQEYEEDGAS